MTTTYLDSGVRRGLAPLAIIVLLVSSGWSAEPQQKPAASDATAAKLVRAALEKELAGANDERAALLQQAVTKTPDDAAAHWQLGHVRDKDAWLTPAELERSAKQDSRLAEYRRLRDAAGLTVEDQVALAQWCRKNKLSYEERVHWLLVLQLEPGQPDAVKGLGLRPYQGMLLTNAQIAELKEQVQKLNKAIETWRPLVAQWRRVAGSETSPPAEVREKISTIWDPVEMLALQRAMWRQVGVKRELRQEHHAMCQELAQLLEKNPSPAAAECLAWLAVLSEHQDVRNVAIAGLKQHPLDHYVPLLLSGLQSPIEANLQCMLNPAGHLIARYSLYQEGAMADISFSRTISPQSIAVPTLYFPGPSAVGPRGFDRNGEAYATIARKQRENVAKSQAQAAANEAELRGAVDASNRAIDQANVRIVNVLGQTTGLNLGVEPAKWWNWWWYDHNAYSLVGGSTGSSGYGPFPYGPGGGSDKPVVQYEETPTYPTYEIPHECFAPGTKVWTLTGRLPIEQIKIGDRVFAQDVESGELAYKPVLAVSIRPPTPRMKVGLGQETITTTLGHPFWVVGKGWYVTKQLEVGTSVHTPSGGQPVESIVQEAESDLSYGSVSYNLVVADFNTFFVGAHGILVHDNTPRQPTSALLPGLPAE